MSEEGELEDGELPEPASAAPGSQTYVTTRHDRSLQLTLVNQQSQRKESRREAKQRKKSEKAAARLPAGGAGGSTGQLGQAPDPADVQLHGQQQAAGAQGSTGFFDVYGPDVSVLVIHIA
jgi:hypothetical protein